MKQFKRDTERRKPRSSSRRSGDDEGKPFKRDSRRGSSRRPGFNREGPRGRFDRRDTRRSSRMEKHKVICDKCGKECEVPFKPTSSKPIYCSDCFKKEDNSSNELAEINKKLDKIMKALKIKD